MLEELNESTDLALKLNSQSKICKLLEGSPCKEREETKGERGVRDVMQGVKRELQRLYEEKERAVEEALERHAEEKFQASQDIKIKY